MHRGGADPDQGICRRTTARRPRGKQSRHADAACLVRRGGALADLGVHAAGRRDVEKRGGGGFGPPGAVHPHHVSLAARRGGGVSDGGDVPGVGPLHPAREHEPAVQRVSLAVHARGRRAVRHRRRRRRLHGGVAAPARHEHSLRGEGALRLSPDARPARGLYRHLFQDRRGHGAHDLDLPVLLSARYLPRGVVRQRRGQRVLLCG